MRAVGYMSERSKRTDPPPPSHTLAAQNDAFLAYCDAEGYAPAAAFLDPDLSVERPGLHQLLTYLQRPDNGFLMVVVAGFPHLGPTHTEAARTFFQITERGATVVSLAEGPLTESRIVQLWSARQPSADTSRRVRDAMRRRAVRGQALGRPPYGYRVGEDHKLAVVEEEAALVRYIFRLSLREGLGVRRIAKRLNEDGYRTRRDGNWSMVTIRDLLHNRVYVGTYARFGVKVPASHPAIISIPDFDAVQEGMQRRRPASSAVPNPSRFLLSGLVRCGDSGTRMIGVTRRQRWTRRDGEQVSNVYRYYQSEARTNQSVGGYHTRRADELEAEVLRHLTGETPGVVRRAVLSAGRPEAVAAETAVAESKVRSRMRTLDRRLNDRLAAAAAGRLSQDHLRRVAHEIVHDYQLTQEELAVVEQRAKAQLSHGERRAHLEGQLQRIRTDWDRLAFEQRQALLRDVVEEIIVDGDTVRTILRT